MSDTSPEFIGAASPPSISATGNAEYDRLLADRDFKERFPEQYAALEQSVTAARATIGFKGPPADPRTPEERFHDQRYGVEPRSAADYAELQLPDKMQLDGGVSGGIVT